MSVFARWHAAERDHSLNGIHHVLWRAVLRKMTGTGYHDLLSARRSMRELTAQLHPAQPHLPPRRGIGTSKRFPPGQHHHRNAVERVGPASDRRASSLRRLARPGANHLALLAEAGDQRPIVLGKARSE